MPPKIRSLRFLKNQISAIENKTKDLKGVSIYSIKHYVEELDRYFSNFSLYYEREDLSEAAEKEFADYDEKYQKAKALLLEQADKILERKPGEFLSDTSTSEKSIAGLLDRQNELLLNFSKIAAGGSKSEGNRLPFLKIPVFKGDLKEWVKFKNLFTSIVNNSQTLSNAEKLNHLLSLVDGEPLSLIKHFPVSGNNYMAAWNSLIKEYDNSFLLVRNMIAEVSNSPALDGKGSSLRSLYGVLTETIQSLDSMNDYGRSRDPWVIYAVTKKFDKETARRWAEEIVDNVEPSVERLVEFLRDMCSANRIMGDTINSKFLKLPVSVKGMNVTMTKCFVCGDSHKIFQCPKFINLDVKERDKLIKNESRCINCLGIGHFSTKCTNKGTCFHCRKRHHTLLHYESNSRSLVSNNVNEKVGSGADQNKSSVEDGLVKAHFAFNSRSNSAILPTAIIEIRDGFGRFQSCRALLDCGAQASFITERCFQRLGLVRTRAKAPIQFMSGSNIIYSKGSSHSTFRALVGGSTNVAINMHILPKLTDQLPERALCLVSADCLKRKFNLADPNFDSPGDIDLIIGADHFFSMIGPGKYYHKTDNIWILESNVGWLVSGGSVFSEDSVVSVNSVSHSEPLDEILEKFWELEEPLVNQTCTEEERLCEEIFEKTTIRCPDGKYSVSLPFKQPKVAVGDSYKGALNRFRSLERRFRTDSGFYQRYKDLISLFIKEGYLESVPLNCIDVPISDRFYLPHYGILRSNGTSSKLRIVFDASAKSDNGISLNDCIMTGPKYQSDIFSLLLNFRIHEFVFTADIIKMYRQVKINESNRDFQRILWRESENKPIQHFRLLTLMDGVNAAPYLALRTMTRLADDESERFPLGAKAISSRYMDDFFVGRNKLDDLISMRDELIRILSSAGMFLDKWASNDSRILSGIELKNMHSGNDIEFETSQSMKTLGIIWNFRGDYFTFSYGNEPLIKHTKRSLLSDSARIFDPCGWISPVTVLLKNLFQETWLTKVSWDEPLPEKIKSRWLGIRNELGWLSELRLSRHLGAVRNLELHGFCDSSNKAYAAVIYARVRGNSGEIFSKLITSKTKLCPLKPISIARLELCGAQLLAKLLRSIQSIFTDLNPTYHCWTDSKTVLAWLSSSPLKWKPFIANRCGHVNDLLPGVAWRYVKSENNPADIASRGLLPEKLSNSQLWWNGPSWLREDWRSFFPTEVFDTLEEMRPLCVTHVVYEKPYFIRMVERFSCFQRFRRSFAYFIKFIRYVREGRTFRAEPLSVIDLSDAMEVFIKLLQFQQFEGEISLLRSNKPILKSSKLASLSPFLDKKGILRVGGRLSEALISYNSKHPILIPDGYFLELLIRFVHEKYYHAGLKLTLSLLKQDYYVCRMKVIVKRVISGCFICTKLRAKTYEPEMSSLPKSRLDFSKPFEVTGIDFAGPILLRPYVGKGKITTKGYISVMVCMSTKAVHLELVTSLSTESLIMALKRFFSRYGHCKEIISDNGRNFVGCARLLKEFYSQILNVVSQPETKAYLLDHLITWKFIPPYSPNFGGIWEAAVKSAKFHLSRIFLGRILTIEEFSTALAEITAILNSRPLTAMSEDLNDFGVITPSHLISGNSSFNLPLLNPEIGNQETASKRFREISSIVNLFWKKWRNEYFQEYMKRYKWKFSGRLPEVGDLVLIKRTIDQPAHFLLGRVTKLFPGKDNISRVVEVRTATGTKTEAIRNLVPLLLKYDTSTGGIC